MVRGRKENEVGVKSMKIEEEKRSKGPIIWTKETYVKMDHTSSLCVPPSNIR
jgi:hypothetical protein